ncbi:MAG: helix-turn-helix transcriptional regulator [Actinomycetota bacterium]|nr:helix-turn-helix transcriptional regulator [Actinomycetota bacterium]
MSDGSSNPIRYFGQQVRRARRTAGWTLTEFGQRIGYDPGQISRIENGKRPPTELFAQMCDRAFPDRDRWFGEFYAESRTWIATPPWFRSWVEHEQHSATLRIWQLGVLSGLLQTEEYARAILTVNPGVTDDQVSERLAARLARQEILARDDPLAAWFLVDEAALRRCIGSPQVMAAQLAHLAGIARLPNLTVQVVPNIAHAGLLGGFAVAEQAAYVETAVAGQVFEDADVIAGLLTRFDTLRNEAFRGSESLTLIERMCEEWKAVGVRAAIPATTVESA